MTIPQNLPSGLWGQTSGPTRAGGSPPAPGPPDVVFHAGYAPSRHSRNTVIAELVAVELFE